MSDLNVKLDRLADGELPRDEYAALLNSLDHVEDGWKSCALALLEHQTLRTELRRLVDEPTPVQPAPAPATSGGWSHTSHWLQALALAACLGLSFWLGRGSLPRGEVAVVPPAEPHVRSETNNPHQGRMTLVMEGPDGQPREVELPVVDGNYVDPRAFLSRSAVIPPDVLAAIERSGHKIERRREFMRQPVDAEHEVVVPVDRLRVVPVSLPKY